MPVNDFDIDALLRKARKKPLFDQDACFETVDYDRVEIEKRLPHRGPMLLIDRVTAVDIEGGRIIGTRYLRDDDPGFSGHFPGYPVYPGVLQVEMVGQLGIFLAQVATDVEHGERSSDSTKSIRLLRIRDALFVRELRPNDLVTVQAQVFEDTGLTFACLGQISCGDEVASIGIVEAVITDESE